tara:strand:+ start:1417 stop:1848 length:432 start_codon:yes stop_codon:yes gene_type:complete
MTTTTLAAYRPSLLGRNVFDDLFGDFPALMNRTTQGYPVADIYRNEQDETVMEFALAGFEKENLHVEIYPDKRSIHVSADSHGDEEQAGFDSRRIARRAFHKTYVNYDNNLDLGSASAEFENGLLRLVVPMRPEAKSLKIEIK